VPALAWRQASAKVKSLGPAMTALAEWGLNPLPLETALIDRGAILPVQCTSEAHRNHARAEQASPSDMGGFAGLGLEEASRDASVAMAIQSMSPSKSA
jgi:hypothetical protein